MKLDKAFLDEQKKKLTERREQILAQLQKDTVPSKKVDNDYDAKFPQYGDKDEDNAAEVAEYSENLTMEKNLELSLFNVDKALKKIAEGNYGICEKCGNAIDAKRLEAFPSATACMNCKQKNV